MDVFKYLKKLVELEGSDLYISAGIPPTARVEGKTAAISKQIVTAKQTQEMVAAILSKEQFEEFEQQLELNLALHLPKIGRFRVNVFKQRGEFAFVARHVKTEIPSMEALSLPSQLRTLIDEQEGLILFVGGTGVGKSTSLASMIAYRSKHRTGHILSIEDPIEFIHSHAQSIINQREVGVDTHSYSAALANALREAPDVIMVGEIREAETMRHALNYAETGHLCVATLHANNASQALDRIINFFGHEAHNQIRADISSFLKAIVAQKLCIGLDGKQVATFEIMMNTPHISDLILKGRVIDIKDAMMRSKEVGHRTFDEDLFGLYQNGKISKEEALRHAVSRNNLNVMFQSDSQKKNPKIIQNEEHKSISFDANATFSEYSSFRIRQPDVDSLAERNQAKAINKALLNAFQGKGLKFDVKRPDIDIYYGFEYSNDSLRLEGVRNDNDKANAKSASARRKMNFSVNIRDIRQKKDVWRRLNASFISGILEDQERCDEEINTLLMAYPSR